ncbi:hypothetical protein JCM14469_37550 [Desulfatiferula olefinivorans]
MRWGFSEVYAQVARFHDAPEAAHGGSRDLLLVGLANRLSHHLSKTVRECFSDPRVMFCAEGLGIDERMLPDLFLRARMFVADRME